jgi:hypothetical protein
MLRLDQHRWDQAAMGKTATVFALLAGMTGPFLLLACSPPEPPKPPTVVDRIDPAVLAKPVLLREDLAAIAKAHHAFKRADQFSPEFNLDGLEGKSFQITFVLESIEV